MDFNFYKTSLWVTQIMFLKIVLALQLESICLGQYSGNKVQLCFLVRARARARVCGRSVEAFSLNNYVIA